MTPVSALAASVDTDMPAPLEREIPVALIDIGRDHRKHPTFAIQAMAEDIGIRGQLSAIEVLVEGDRYRLTFGRLRLEAVRHLNAPTVRAIVRTAEEFASDADIRLRSISENLLHSPLTALYRNLAIADWCAIYRAAQPAIKPGPKPGAKQVTELSLTVRPNSEEEMLETSDRFALSFSEAAQSFLGISRASVFRALKIAAIPALLRERIETHAIADRQNELIALAGLTEVRQSAVIDLILGEKAATVDEAIALLEGVAVVAKEAWESLADKFSRWQPQHQERFFEINEAAIERWMAKRGRI
ncbi:MAG: ParB/RepB/Spo0J family partition protein [Allorhizobium sp.]